MIDDFIALVAASEHLNRHRATVKKLLRDCEALLNALNTGLESSVPVGDYRLHYGRRQRQQWCLMVTHPTLTELPPDVILRVMVDGLPSLIEQLCKDCDAVIMQIRTAIGIAQTLAYALETSEPLTEE